MKRLSSFTATLGLVVSGATAAADPAKVAGKIFNVGGGPDKAMSVWAEFGAILEELLLDVMYEVPGMPEVGQVVVTEQAVRGEVGPELLTRQQLAERTELSA